MSSCSIPVSLHGLGVEGDNNSKLLGNSLKEISGNPEVITHGNSFTGSNLGFHDSHLLQDTSMTYTWNSHWAGITSALVPLTLMPA